jgi:hypothetical protein
MASPNVTKSEIQMDLTNELHDVLVCQSCDIVPRTGPIYTCESGDHATCNGCFRKYNVCKCKADIEYRNKGLEKVRDTLPHSCKFRKNGCDAILPLESLLDHEVGCQWRQIFCPSLICRTNKSHPFFKVVFKMLDDHLTNNHTALAKKTKNSHVFSGITKHDLNTEVPFLSNLKRHFCSVWGV